MTTEAQVRIILAKIKKQDGIITPTETKMLGEWAEIALRKQQAERPAVLQAWTTGGEY